MKIIKPSATYLSHKDITPYEFIEKVGRTCYKSEDRITKGSAKKFIENLVNRNHWAMLEHETLYLVTSYIFMKDFLEEMSSLNEQLTYFNITHSEDTNVISGSFRSFNDLFERVLFQSKTLNVIRVGLTFVYPEVFRTIHTSDKLTINIGDYADYECILVTRESFIDKFLVSSPQVLYKHLTHTVKFVCDRGVSHEFVRHRPCSFAQESTRYCNYSLDKFGDEITVIKPLFFEQWDKDLDNRCETMSYGLWARSCEQAEKAYFNLLKEGATPQEARSVLPNSLKTELIITATEEEWGHVVDLRFRGTTGAPHPQMKEVMSMALKDLLEASCGRIVIYEYQ